MMLRKNFGNISNVAEIFAMEMMCRNAAAIACAERIAADHNRAIAPPLSPCRSTPEKSSLPLLQKYVEYPCNLFFQKHDGELQTSRP